MGHKVIKVSPMVPQTKDILAHGVYEKRNCSLFRFGPRKVGDRTAESRRGLVPLMPVEEEVVPG